jgi:hypothetical protein
LSMLPKLTGVIVVPNDWGWSVWPPRKEGDGFNIIPDDDTRMHINGPNCWCNPDEDDQEPDLWHHIADDRRDDYFMGRKHH